MLQTHAPVLIVVFPLLCAFILSIVGLYSKKACWPLALVGTGGSFIFAILMLLRVLKEVRINYHLGGWVPPIGIEFVVDKFNAAVLVVVTFILLVVAVHAKIPIQEKWPEKRNLFYAVYLLLAAGLLGMTSTGDAFNLYVMLEISALTTYALIAFGGGKAYLATFNYIIMGTIGASFYLLGVGYLYIKTGSLNMADLLTIIPQIAVSETILVAFILIIVGVFIKMAFFPLGAWLPNAYSYAPAPVGALMAPLATKISVYVMIRIMFWVFSAGYVFVVLPYKEAFVWLAVLAILAGAFYALAQRDLRKMLSYIIIAEVGYMVGGVWLGNELGLTGSIFHIFSDALVTALLFLVVSVIVYKTGGQSFDSMKGLFKKMPITMTFFILGALSMVGVPPTSGFFSKFYLVSGAIAAGHWPFMCALLFSSLINVVLFVRLIEIAHFSEDSHHKEHAESEIDEAPALMLLPIAVVAIAILALGFYSDTVVSTMISPIVGSIF